MNDEDGDTGFGNTLMGAGYGAVLLENFPRPFGTGRWSEPGRTATLAFFPGCTELSKHAGSTLCLYQATLYGTLWQQSSKTRGTTIEKFAAPDNRTHCAAKRSEKITSGPFRLPFPRSLNYIAQ